MAGMNSQDIKAALALKREKFIEADKVLDMYKFMNLHTAESLPKTFVEVKAEYTKAHAEYLSALVFEACELISDVVRDSESFYFEDYYICIKRESGKKFKQYIPPPGRGNGIYDGIIWDDFELLLDDEHLDLFKSKGIAIDRVYSNGREPLLLGIAAEESEAVYFVSVLEGYC